MIKLGDIDVYIKIGSADAKLYLGDTLVYGGDSPTPPHDYSQDYLTFVPSEPYGCTFSCTNNSISYSLDNGSTWGSLAGEMPIVMNNEKMLVKANGITPTSSAGIGTFSSTGRFEAEGNIMSLVSGDSFAQATTIANYQFKNLFKGCTGLTSAENLVIPATTLTNNCYYQMFHSCSGLTTPPALPATTLARSCYEYMFAYCTSLTTSPVLPATTLDTTCYRYMFFHSAVNSVTCLATDISATNCTNRWLDAASATGTFTKAASMNDWPSGGSGIPDGWTVIDQVV